ncbi:MAG TPA: hypothetical protein VGE98_04815 [Thermoanaerobaculia bacterium]
MLCLLPLAAAFAAVSVHKVLDLRESGRAKLTESQMHQLAIVLSSEQTSDIDPASLRALSAKRGYPDYTRDGWGRDIGIEIATDAKGEKHYTLRSLGRDGKRGGCCAGRLKGRWDEDAVLADGEWAQMW